MIRVLIVDDSISMRGVLARIVNRSEGMTCVGAAENAHVAREMIRELAPDVITLDVEMPGMNGLEFLERLMRLRPTPTIMLSSRTTHGSEAALQALELGAVDVMAKPVLSTANDASLFAHAMAEMVRVAALAKVRPSIACDAAGGSTVATPAGVIAPKRGAFTSLGAAGSKTPVPGCGTPPTGAIVHRRSPLMVIGSSTGGTEALKVVLQCLPDTVPPILMAQHMPETFTASFAARLDSLCRIRVKEAEDGELLRRGTAYLAPGHSHLKLVAAGANYACRLEASAPVNRHRPSVDVLFHSCAEVAGKQAIGVILTGMGKDGAAGMLAMRQAGALNLAQDEHSCVVFGMPKEAIAAGGVHEVMPLEKIAARLLDAVR